MTYDFKYNVGDKVTCIDSPSEIDTIDQIVINRHGIFYDLYFKMVKQEVMEDINIYQTAD